ncbi:hypothetical protein D3C84_1157130 [compost metagenome]
MNDTLSVNDRPNNRLDDVEAFQFIQSRLNPIFAGFLGRFASYGRLCRSHRKRWLKGSAHG